MYHYNILIYFINFFIKLHFNRRIWNPNQFFYYLNNEQEWYGEYTCNKLSYWKFNFSPENVVFNTRFTLLTFINFYVFLIRPFKDFMF
jgi:hypothetical protein